MADLVAQLADWLAARVSPPLAREASPYAMFAHGVVETAQPNYTDPYSVLRCYGGDAIGNAPVRSASIQCYTVGTSASACIARAYAIREALLGPRDADEPGTPMRDVPLPDFFIYAFEPVREPGLIGLDARQRAEAVFNFDVVYRVL